MSTLCKTVANTWETAREEVVSRRGDGEAASRTRARQNGNRRSRMRSEGWKRGDRDQRALSGSVIILYFHTGLSSLSSAVQENPCSPAETQRKSFTFQRVFSAPLRVIGKPIFVPFITGSPRFVPKRPLNLLFRPHHGSGKTGPAGWSGPQRKRLEIEWVFSAPLRLCGKTVLSLS